MEKSKKVGVTEWSAKCPYCNGNNYFEEGYRQSCEIGNKPIVIECDDCKKNFIVEINPVSV